MTLPILYPTMPSLGLSEFELDTIATLQRRLFWELPRLEIRDAYYNGENLMADLGISIPPQLEGLHTVIGWPRIAVDALDERLDIEGFRYPDSTDADQDLWEIWQANNLDEESQLAHLDSMILGRSFLCVGSGTCGPGAGKDGCPPLITVESPLNMAVSWHPQSRTVMAAFREYWYEYTWAATLYLPDQTISLMRGTDSQWAVVDRDVHNLGVVPVVRMSNRQRVSDRYGLSEITPELMSITDAACRTLLGAEVAREFYGAPQRYILGVTEEAFQGPDGTPRTGWETYLGRVLALDRDEEGNVPSVGQFQAYDPSVYTKIIDMYSKIVSSMTGLPPHFLGQTTDNPASADAIRSSESRLNKKAERKQGGFSGPWEDVMRLALLIRDGDVPDNAAQMETIWRPVATPTPAATTDAISKQVQAGILPASSDVTLEELGYTSVQRQRIAADRKRDEGRAVLAELASSLEAKQARTDMAVSSDIVKGNEPVTVKPSAPAKPSK